MQRRSMDNERSFTVGRFDRTGPYDGITGDLGVGSSRRGFGSSTRYEEWSRWLGNSTCFARQTAGGS